MLEVMAVAIPVLGAVLGVGFVLTKWMLRWSASNVLDVDGRLVMMPGKDWQRPPPQLFHALNILSSYGYDFWVEVVADDKPIITAHTPTGVVEGRRVAGSFRVEQPLPLMKKHYVAVVHEKFAGPLLIHEVTRHILPMQQAGTPDPEHALEKYADIERQCIKLWTEAMEHHG